MVSTDRWVALASRLYFESSYGLLTRSPEGRRFLQLTAPVPGTNVHGYTTAADVDALVRALEPDASGTLLDLGCGVGGVALEVSRRMGTNVTGVDLSARAIETAISRASGVAVNGRLTFVQGSIRCPPRVGASGAYALDSLMFVPVDVDALSSIRDALVGRGRLFSTVLGVGTVPNDPVASVAALLGMTVVESVDVTDGLVARNKWRRRVARHLLRRRPISIRGKLAMALVVVEESLVRREVGAGRLRRWRTVVDLRTQV